MEIFSTLGTVVVFAGMSKSPVVGRDEIDVEKSPSSKDEPIQLATSSNCMTCLGKTGCSKYASCSINICNMGSHEGCSVSPGEYSSWLASRVVTVNGQRTVVLPTHPAAVSPSIMNDLNNLSKTQTGGKTIQPTSSYDNDILGDAGARYNKANNI